MENQDSNNLANIVSNCRSQSKLDKKEIIGFSFIFQATQVLTHPVYSAFKDRVALDIYTFFLHQSTSLGQHSKGNKRKISCLFSLCDSWEFFYLSKGFIFLFISSADQRSALFYFAFVFSPLLTPHKLQFATVRISKPFCSLE